MELFIFGFIILIIWFVYDCFHIEDKYDKNGFDKNGCHKNGTQYDNSGYDVNGYNKAGYNRDGYDRTGYNKAGYNKDGYDREGYDRYGYDREGYDWEGYDWEGYNRTGYNQRGCDRDGYARDGYNREGYDRAGYNRAGYARDGYNRDGYNKYGEYNRCRDTANMLNKDGFYNIETCPISFSAHAEERLQERVGIGFDKMYDNVIDAYSFGKSKRQVSSKNLIERMISIEQRHREKEECGVLLYNNYFYLFSKDNCLITVYKNENVQH